MNRNHVTVGFREEVIVHGHSDGSRESGVVGTSERRKFPCCGVQDLSIQKVHPDLRHVADSIGEKRIDQEASVQ